MKSRVKLENLARKKGITQMHEKTTEALIELLLTNHKFNRKELNIIASNLDIKKAQTKSLNTLINAFNRFRDLSHETLKKLGELQ